MVAPPSSSVEDYLTKIPEPHQELFHTLLHLCRTHIPDGYQEVIAWGMLTYQVPMEISGPTYNGEPLMYAALSPKKHHIALYLMSAYCDPALSHEYELLKDSLGASRVGKSCLRLRTSSEVPTQTVIRLLSAHTPDQYAQIVTTLKQG